MDKFKKVEISEQKIRLFHNFCKFSLLNKNDYINKNFKLN